MTNTLFDALAAGLVDPEEAKAILGQAARHAGGRPKGSRNKGRCRRCQKRAGECQCDEAEIVADALDKAIVALSERRSRMTAAEREESERRILALLTNKGGDMPFADNRHAAKAQRKWLAAHALPEEKAVVEVYKRQEDRIGRSRKRKVAISKNGEVIVGYVSDAEPSIVNFTDHGLAGKRAKRPWLAPVSESGGCWHGVGDLPEVFGDNYSFP